MVAVQFPRCAHLRVTAVKPGGWDNRTYRLGMEMSIRLPSQQRYAAQIEKEHRWLPVLGPLLPLPIPVPLGKGEPVEGFPCTWSIYRWLEGETAASERIGDKRQFATDLAQFLVALQEIDATGGAAAGLITSSAAVHSPFTTKKLAVR